MTPHRTRVLIEHENPHIRQRQAAALEPAGFDVTTCAGPTAPQGQTCPPLAASDCDRLCAADVVVNELPMRHLRVYVAQQALVPDRPVLLGLSEHDEARFPILAQLPHTLPRDATDPVVVHAVQQALSSNDSQQRADS